MIPRAFGGLGASGSSTAGGGARSRAVSILRFSRSMMRT